MSFPFRLWRYLRGVLMLRDAFPSAGRSLAMRHDGTQPVPRTAPSVAADGTACVALAFGYALFARWRIPACGYVAPPERAQAAREFAAGEGLGSSRANIWAEAGDLAYRDHRGKPRPSVRIPSVRLSEALDVRLGRAAESPLGVVDLCEVPFAGPDGDVVPEGPRRRACAGDCRGGRRRG